MMKRFVVRLLLTVVVLLLFATTGEAQVIHPCDLPLVTNGTVTAGLPFTFGWCDDGKDTSGNAQPVTGYIVYRNGAPLAGLFPVVDPTPNASGFHFVHVGLVEPTGVTVTLTVTALNAQGESAASIPFVLTSVVPAAKPRAPGLLRATQP